MTDDRNVPDPRGSALPPHRAAASDPTLHTTATTVPAPASGPGPLREPPPGTGAMNVLRWVMFGGLLLIAVVGAVVWVLYYRGPRTDPGPLDPSP